MFLPSDTLVASGLSYQIVDIFLSELYAHSEQYGPIESHDTLTLLLEPFCASAAYTSDKILLQKLKEHLFNQIAVDLEKSKVHIAWKHLDKEKFAGQLFEIGKAQTSLVVVLIKLITQIWKQYNLV